MAIPSCRMATSKEIHDNGLANTGETGPCAHCWWECKPITVLLKYLLSHSFQQKMVQFSRTLCWPLLPFSTMKLSDCCLTCNVIKRVYLLQMQFAVIFFSSFITTCFNVFIKFISTHSLHGETGLTVALVFKNIMSCDYIHPLPSLHA